MQNETVDHGHKNGEPTLEVDVGELVLFVHEIDDLAVFGRVAHLVDIAAVLSLGFVVMDGVLPFGVLGLLEGDSEAQGVLDAVGVLCGVVGAGDEVVDGLGVLKPSRFEAVGVEKSGEILGDFVFFGAESDWTALNLLEFAHFGVTGSVDAVSKS